MEVNVLLTWHFPASKIAASSHPPRLIDQTTSISYCSILKLQVFDKCQNGDAWLPGFFSMHEGAL
eukprot:9078673-Ditylum_brightwellii.AAC.1